MRTIDSATKEPSAARAWLKPVLREFPPDRRAAPRGTAVPLRGLHLNESPYPPSPKAVEAIRSAAANLNRYADANAAALAKALAQRTAIAPDRIVIACGSEELIQVLCSAAAGPGDEVVVPAPSFPSFALGVSLQGATPVRAKLDRGGANDAGAILRAISGRTRLVFCCTPNPPSGGMMSKAALEQLVSGVPERVLLVVDEAYHEFGRHVGGPDALAILARRRGPWAALRTFSKAYGLAGARIGYALCSDLDVADALRRLKLYYGASSLAQAGALASLEDEAHLASTLDAVARERARLADGLRGIGLAPLPSAANFVSVKAPMPALDAMALLQERGILVRDWRDPEHLNELRITIGRAEDTDAVVSAMKDIIAAARR